MWQLIYGDAHDETELRGAARELVEATARRLMVVVTGLYLLFHVVATAVWPQELGWSTWIITLVLVVGTVSGYHLLRYSSRLAILSWQIGLAIAIALATAFFHRPEVAFLYALLPMVALLTVGWAVALCNSIVVAGLVWWLAVSVTPSLFSVSYLLTLLAASAITAAIGWVSARSLMVALGWSLAGFRQARQNMDEARQHRGQLARLLKDLDQAYYQLERTNAALLAARRAAEEAERFKSELVTTVSHELRTPLNLIVGYTEIMLTAPESYADVALPGPYRTDMNTVYKSARHLLALVDDILDVARIEIGRITLEREEVVIASLVEQTVAMVADYVTAKGLALRVEIAPDLPLLWIDRLRVRQVLLNLLVNAARHTRQGTIALGVLAQDEEIIFSVEDTGAGIAEEDLSRVFEEFRSTGPARSDLEWHSGSGLGLPISRKFVELHGGRMGVKSTLGKGTCFWITLPLQPASSAGVDLRPYAQPKPLVRLGADERVVVVVGQDENMIRVWKRSLDSFQILGAANLDAAFALAHESKALALLTNGVAPLPASFTDIEPDNLLLIQCPFPTTRHIVPETGISLEKPVARQDLLAVVDQLQPPPQRVLIVDDDPEVVRLYRRILRARVPVQNCLEAYNGREALAILHQELPDLVLLDLMMPEVDGQTVLARMAEDPQLATIPVIVISGRGRDYMDMQVAGPLHVQRRGGFPIGELAHLVNAMLDASAGAWRASLATGPGLAEAHAELQALADNPRPPMSSPPVAH